MQRYKICMLVVSGFFGKLGGVELVSERVDNVEKSFGGI